MVIENFSYPFEPLVKGESYQSKYLGIFEGRTLRGFEAKLEWINDEGMRATGRPVEKGRAWYTHTAPAWVLIIEALTPTRFHFTVSELGMIDGRWEMWGELEEQAVGTIENRGIGNIEYSTMNLHNMPVLEAMLPRLLELMGAAWRGLPRGQRRYLAELLREAQESGSEPR